MFQPVLKLKSAADLNNDVESVSCGLWHGGASAPADQLSYSCEDENHVFSRDGDCWVEKFASFLFSLSRRLRKVLILKTQRLTITSRGVKECPIDGCNQKWDSSLDNALYLEKMK